MKELDWESISNEKYRAACTKCIRELGKSYDIVPSSFFCQNVQREGSFPVGGGGFAVSWRLSLQQSALTTHAGYLERLNRRHGSVYQGPQAVYHQSDARRALEGKRWYYHPSVIHLIPTVRTAAVKLLSGSSFAIQMYFPS